MRTDKLYKFHHYVCGSHINSSGVMALSATQLDLLKVAFRPHAPIEAPDNFIGREEERERVTEALSEPGLQVVIFGERGAGKTSLANVATAIDGVERIQVFCEAATTFEGICGDILLNYATIRPSSIKYDAVNNTVDIDGSTIAISKLSGNILLKAFKDKKQLCIILDELDRIQDKTVISKLSELAKNISTYHTHITLVFIGVSTNADELLNGHISNFRNLRQIQLGRMTRQELIDIIRRGESVLSIRFLDDTIEEILQLCDSFPYYLHLLATSSAKISLAAGSTEVTLTDLAAGIGRAAADADQSLRDVYDHAILSVKKSDIYRRVIWAMSSLDGTSHIVSEIASAANAIAVQEHAERVSIQAIGTALVTLKSESKRNILHSRVQGFNSFSNPLMKGFVRLIRAKQ